MLGRLTISTDRVGICQGATIVFWMILDTFNIFYSPLKIASTLCEALITMGLLGHVAFLTKGLQERGRRRWLIKLVAATLWCMGWGVIAVLYWIKQVNQIVVVMWLMTYAAFWMPPGWMHWLKDVLREDNRGTLERVPLSLLATLKHAAETKKIVLFYHDRRERAVSAVDSPWTRLKSSGMLHQRCGALSECYMSHFSIQSARGIVSHQDRLYMLVIIPELPVDLEAKAEVVWNSLKAEPRVMAVATEYPNGIYYSVYTKMWEFPGGERVSTAHLTDGRFVAIGPQLPPLRTATEDNGIPAKPMT
ncbi:hypothetical protein D5F01_LYC01257 [Larimichthys crocea]|uniref:Uncharacterized protein n=1 Tax=Larimichthys crocea TaxID=215358 RepID=A0A6G0JBH6_LARCR|nr:hypothetical protein D5F01_LYC01257 [Larimichthys crocea]